MPVGEKHLRGGAIAKCRDAVGAEGWIDDVSTLQPQILPKRRPERLDDTAFPPGPGIGLD